MFPTRMLTLSGAGPQERRRARASFCCRGGVWARGARRGRISKVPRTKGPGGPRAQGRRRRGVILAGKRSVVLWVSRFFMIILVDSTAAGPREGQRARDGALHVCFAERHLVRLGAH